MVDLWVTHPRRLPTYLLTQASLAVVAVLQLVAFDAGETVYAMQRMVVADPMGHLLGFFATIAVMISIIERKNDRRQRRRRREKHPGPGNGITVIVIAFVHFITDHITNHPADCRAEQRCLGIPADSLSD